MADKEVLYFDLMHNIDWVLRGAIIDSKIAAEWLQGIHRQKLLIIERLVSCKHAVLLFITLVPEPWMGQDLWYRDSSFHINKQHAAYQVLQTVAIPCLIARIDLREAKLPGCDHLFQLAHVLCSEWHSACDHGIQKHTKAPYV